MPNKITTYWNTLKYLAPGQIFYRVYYGIYPDLLRRLSCACVPGGNGHCRPLVFEKSIPCAQAYESGSFTFLNKTRDFARVDWNFSDYGRLWTYNLNYFDFLNQASMTAVEGSWLIEDYISRFAELRDGLDPYPTSCRIINWIKFLSRFNCQTNDIDKSLYLQARMLKAKLEYHLMGNHLLENAFALLFSACYFRDEVLYKKAKDLLESQLNEQVLLDGCHFELSPMYHQVVLFRLLDSINLLKKNRVFDEDLLPFLVTVAARMLAWLQEITFSNGSIPLFNDSAFGIAPTTAELNNYADALGITHHPLPIPHHLRQSGYRMIRGDSYEIALDVGNIGPDYIPGHAHSDTFNFELHIAGNPFIVDTGTSTYEPGTLRLSQRSTRAHNTVQIGEYEQSEVWGSHRVARRAKIVGFDETTDQVRATHDGYRRIGALHTRTFRTQPCGILIEDEVKGCRDLPHHSYLHFHPGIQPILRGDKIVANGTQILFEGARRITLENFDYAPEFNRSMPSKMGIVEFSGNLTTRFLVAEPQ